MNDDRWSADVPSNVQDIVDLRKFTADEFSHIHEVLNGICKFLVAIPGESHGSWQHMAAHGRADMLPCNVRCISVHIRAYPLIP